MLPDGGPGDAEVLEGGHQFGAGREDGMHEGHLGPDEEPPRSGRQDRQHVTSFLNSHRRTIPSSDLFCEAQIIGVLFLTID